MLNFRHLRRTLELRCFCRLAIPHFVELHRKYKDHGLDIVGITYERSDDPNETIRAFANSFEIVYPRVIGDGTAITVQMCFAGEHEVAVGPEKGTQLFFTLKELRPLSILQTCSGSSTPPCRTTARHERSWTCCLPRATTKSAHESEDFGAQ